MRDFDVIVIGGGHAGCEAALASARIGARTLLVTKSIDRLAAMSCNPAIGGTAKGHLVKEIDALGGEMARAIDKTGLQFRVLNRKKGPAVWASRAQADMDLYSNYMKEVLTGMRDLSLVQDSVEEILFNNLNLLDKSKSVQGVKTKVFGEFTAKAVVVTTGTFLNGIIHIGLNSFSAGRMCEEASVGLAECLKSHGLRMGRLKTGTTPRLDGRTINWSVLPEQSSDEDIIPFSFGTEEITQKLLPCYITHTNEKTHDIIREYLRESPLYSGKISGIGPRYCPSIEDKVVKFSEKKSHQIFLEPQGYKTTEIYPNGLSTSLPLIAQIKFINSINGLENAQIIRPGYAIEYDFVDPTELSITLETKKIKGLFLAGQINGTTGYEEAGAQGLVAGINAALMLLAKEPLILKRSESYIGVLIDDLITKGTSEPYRMFTSRAEHRLFLREDNADLRLTDYGHRVGLVTGEFYEKYLKRNSLLNEVKEYLQKTPLKQTSINVNSLNYSFNPGLKLAEIVRRPEVSIFDFQMHNEFLAAVPKNILRRAEIEIKYEGYIKRESKTILDEEELEKIKIPLSISYRNLPGLSREVVEKLEHFKPETLGQASRISGITPAAVQILRVFLA